MKKIYLIPIWVALFAVILSSCLNVEKKEYTVKLNADNSGTMAVKYINIVSTEEEEKDVSMKDFATLITDYYEGDKAIEDFLGAKNMQKRLFEENGVLCAELTFEFDSIGTSNIFQYNEQSPFMAVLGEKFDGETYAESNGEHGLGGLDIVFWDKSIKEFKWSCSVLSDMEGAHSLLKSYKSWEKE